jgi:hypothetical protein
MWLLYQRVFLLMKGLCGKINNIIGSDRPNSCNILVILSKVFLKCSGHRPFT